MLAERSRSVSRQSVGALWLVLFGGKIEPLGCLRYWVSVLDGFLDLVPGSCPPFFVLTCNQDAAVRLSLARFGDFGLSKDVAVFSEDLVLPHAHHRPEFFLTEERHRVSSRVPLCEL